MKQLILHLYHHFVLSSVCMYNRSKSLRATGCETLRNSTQRLFGKKTTKPASGCNHRHSEDTRGSSCTSTTSAVIEQTVVTQHTIKTSTTLESNRGTHAPRACTSADILGRGHNCRIFFLLNHFS